MNGDFSLHSLIPSAANAPVPGAHSVRPMALRGYGILLVLLLCAACGSTPEASRERDAQAKRFEPVTRDAVIYVYRPDLVGTSPETTLWVDGRLAGTSLPSTFFRVLVFPGHNRIETSPPDSGRIVVETLGNEVTFVEMRTEGTMGAPTSFFRQVPAEAGQKTILACCRMLEGWHFNQPRLLW